jgi:hypothetical protein
MKLEIKLFAGLKKSMPKVEKVEVDDSCSVFPPLAGG